MTQAYDDGAANYPAADWAYVIVAGLPWGVGEYSVFEGASPAVANGDTAVCPKVSTPDGFVAVIDATGVPQIDTFGSTARQEIDIDVYDASLDAWMGLTPQYVNNLAPVLASAPTYASTYEEAVPIGNLDIGALASDPEGDALTVTTASTLPPGLTLVGNTVTGTPHVAGVYVVNFVISDALGAPYNLAPWTFTVTPTVVTDTAISSQRTRNHRRGRR